MSICMTDPDPPRTTETASSFHEHMSLKYCFHCITAYYTEVLILLRQSHVIKILWYQEYSFPRLFVPWNIRSLDRSFPGTFVLKTIRSLEHSFPGPFVPWNFHSRYPGPFLPWTVRAFVSRAVPGLEQGNKQKRSPMTATVHSRYSQSGARERFFDW